MILIKYKLGKSKIHGTGFFADEDIPKDKEIWRWDDNTDTEMDEREFLALSDQEQKEFLHLGYKSKHTGKYCYSPDDMHFINHSDDGNTTEAIYEGKGGGTLIAKRDIKRDIKKGEELTQDYREFEDFEGFGSSRRGIDV